jgi:hypothetical protein
MQWEIYNDNHVLRCALSQFAGVITSKDHTVAFRRPAGYAGLATALCPPLRRERSRDFVKPRGFANNTGGPAKPSAGRPEPVCGLFAEESPGAYGPLRQRTA